MRPFGSALPGLQRLRSVHPLIDADGGCSLLFDAERGSVFDVPAELRLHVAPALDTGDLDEELLGWLSGEDLLTGESNAWGSAPAANEVEAWIDCAPGGSPLDDLDLAFRLARGCSRLTLHLDWVGFFPPGGWLERLVHEAQRRAGVAGHEVSFELALDPQQVTPEVARRLAAQPVAVRLRCGESDLAAPASLSTLESLSSPSSLKLLSESQASSHPWLLAEPAVRLLLDHLAPRSGRRHLEAPPGAEPATRQTPAPISSAAAASLTVQCLLDGGARLIELWRWANTLGVRHLDVIRLEESGPARHLAGRGATAAGLGDYSQDLLAIQEETADALEAGRQPTELQSLTRGVRILMRNAGLPNLAAPHRLHGSHLGMFGIYGLADAESGAGGAVPCRTCWASGVCSHSALAPAPPSNEDPRGRTTDTCGIWASEAEAAVRFYHRLAQIDPIKVRRFLFGEPVLDLPALHPAGMGGGAARRAALASIWDFDQLLLAQPS